jgi:hypothetical protein
VNPLEPVVRRELQTPLLRANGRVGDIAEITVGDSGIRVSVAGDVQSIESIEAEAERLLVEGSWKVWHDLA